MNAEEESWGATKGMERDKELRSTAEELGPIKMRSQASKREQDQLQKGAKSKKLKQALSEDLGRELNNNAAHHTTSPPTTICRENLS